MDFEVPELPFAKDALEPHISRHTLSYHYDKHHKGYMSKLDDALADSPRREETLEAIMLSSDGHIFNCAAQVWNHTFYWDSMDPGGDSRPSDALAEQINKDFGDLDSLKKQLKDAGAGEFGSGWAWLCYDCAAGRLVVTSTGDAGNPLTDGLKPLLTVDVWEHAYYLDHQNDRGGYLDGVIASLLNWRFASDNFSAAAQ